MYFLQNLLPVCLSPRLYPDVTCEPVKASLFWLQFRCLYVPPERMPCFVNSLDKYSMKVHNFNSLQMDCIYIVYMLFVKSTRTLLTLWNNGITFTTVCNKSEAYMNVGRGYADTRPPVYVFKRLNP